MNTMRPTRGSGPLDGFLARKRAEKADRLIPDGLRKGRILDIGCGSYPLFLSSIEFTEKYGLDKSIPLDLRPGGINLLNYDIETRSDLSFDDGYFDVVTMLAVFEHIEKTKLNSLLKEIYRVLKPGGVYILTTPASWTDPVLRTLAKLKLISSIEIEEHKDAYSHAKISSFLTQAGFGEEQIELGHFELWMNSWARAGK
jgi:2-polyprenyl-3-methyl-5-hydroxy-6-metoxy-1,4-benzoquinol methylase